MPLSRLRLRLAAWFALAFICGLVALTGVLHFYMWRESDQGLTRELRRVGNDLARFAVLEYHEHPDLGMAAAVREALAEFPEGPETFVVYAAAGARLGERGDSTRRRHAPATLAPADGPTVRDLPSSGAAPVRYVLLPPRGDPAFRVLVAATTVRMVNERAALVLWLAASVPVVLALSLAGGYMLSSRALRPIQELQRAVAGIAPDALDRRLPVSRTPDELDRLAAQFNDLLERLERTQQQSRRFLRQAAHQIRTPLTLVLGEAALSLDRARTVGEQRQTLERIQRAADQMRRHVDELFLLAEAEAGLRPTMDEKVELDGLVLECADLMRGRATGLGQRLELLRVDAVSVRGNEVLLREGLLELIENACRHGSREQPVGISAVREGEAAQILVASHGPPITPDAGSEPAAANGEGRGLGLSIVRWIAGEHGGVFVVERQDGRNVVGFRLPALA
jgi:signal transduction histidine kinase